MIVWSLRWWNTVGFTKACNHANVHSYPRARVVQSWNEAWVEIFRRILENLTELMPIPRRKLWRRGSDAARSCPNSLVFLELFHIHPRPAHLHSSPNIPPLRHATKRRCPHPLTLTLPFNISRKGYHRRLLLGSRCHDLQNDSPG